MTMTKSLLLGKMRENNKALFDQLIEGRPVEDNFRDVESELLLENVNKEKLDRVMEMVVSNDDIVKEYFGETTISKVSELRGDYKLLVKISNKYLVMYLAIKPSEPLVPIRDTIVYTLIEDPDGEVNSVAASTIQSTIDASMEAFAELD